MYQSTYELQTAVKDHRRFSHTHLGLAQQVGGHGGLLFAN